ncbi:MAG: hypothetical protein H6744_06690 [Deltaproteobacteria bacterium]|nr:hypothetical protein [Deltaproteobacteria bacterium]MCB9786367.1 hypothetical protein [Deltaproteobacteria bacterium]
MGEAPRSALGSVLAAYALAWVCAGAPGCGREPADKVVRWAAEVLPATTAEAPEPEDASTTAPPVEAPAAEPADADEDAALTPCERLLARACEGLGPDGEECAEARRAFPAERPPEWEAACDAVLERHHALIEAKGEPARGKGLNACRLLQQRLCEESGPNTWACQEARDDANRLRRQRQTTSCLGDLLLREQAAIFSVRPPESGR